MPINRTRDDIDMIVDRILARPDRADELKSALRDRIHNRAPRSGDRAMMTVTSVEAEAFWDNVPV
jgi:hypothetical protein